MPVIQSECCLPVLSSLENFSAIHFWMSRGVKSSLHSALESKPTVGQHPHRTTSQIHGLKGELMRLNEAEDKEKPVSQQLSGC